MRPRQQKQRHAPHHALHHAPLQVGGHRSHVIRGTGHVTWLSAVHVLAAAQEGLELHEILQHHLAGGSGGGGGRGGGTIERRQLVQPLLARPVQEEGGGARWRVCGHCQPRHENIH